MRELTLAELERVSGGSGDHSESSYYNPGGGGGGDPTPFEIMPDSVGAASWTSVASLNWANVSQDMSEFFESMYDTNYHGGGDQNSGYRDDFENYAPWTFALTSGFNLSADQRENLGYHYYDYLTQAIDPEFMFTSMGSGGFSGYSGDGGAAAVAPIDANSFLMNTNGLTFMLTKHQASGGSPDPEDLVVNGAHYDAVLVGMSQQNNQTPAPIPTPATAPTQWTGPDMNMVNPVGFVTAPDGASYYLPEGIDGSYLMAALNHLSVFASTHSKAALLVEFKAMYENPQHAHFIDFKEWGTPSKPMAGGPAPEITYFSQALGHNVTASAYEPFGNFFYGLAARWAGINTDVLLKAADFLQEGNPDVPWFLRSDSPEDKPHVRAGIDALEAWRINGGTLFKVYTGDGVPTGL